MSKISIILNVILLLVSGYLLFDNAALLEKTKAFDTLVDEYDQSHNKIVSVAECIDELNQYELDDGNIVIKAEDIKNCVDKIQREEFKPLNKDEIILDSEGNRQAVEVKGVELPSP